MGPKYGTILTAVSRPQQFEITHTLFVVCSRCIDYGYSCPKLLFYIFLFNNRFFRKFFFLTSEATRICFFTSISFYVHVQNLVQLINHSFHFNKCMICESEIKTCIVSELHAKDKNNWKIIVHDYQLGKNYFIKFYRSTAKKNMGPC